jgi:hypothetical protein
MRGRTFARRLGYLAERNTRIGHGNKALEEGVILVTEALKEVPVGRSVRYIM